METKPFSLQSPEQIAKDYGGNKQKIAEAMQLGVLDPTAGTLAAMFIDRMRSAAQVEAAPQQTVAQKIFAPPQMPAGLGATPQAAQMAMPPVNPTASAPPSAGLGGIGGAPQAPGMADGGLVRNDMFSAPYMNDGGLAALPVPDGMFDEPSNGGFAGGGLVAFATGTDEDGVQSGDTLDNYYGYYQDPEKMKEQLAKLYTPDRTYTDKLMAMLSKEQSPEEVAARRKQDMWMALGQLGAKMASTPGSLLQAASAGIGAALPGIAEAAKTRRTEQRDALKTQAQMEGLNNREALDMAKLVMEGTDKYGQFDMKRLDREQQERIENYRQTQENWRSKYSADQNLAGQGLYADKLLLSQVGGSAQKATSEFEAELTKAGTHLGDLYMQLSTAKTPKEKAQIEGAIDAARTKYVRTQVLANTGWDLSQGWPSIGGRSTKDPLDLRNK